MDTTGETRIWWTTQDGLHEILTTLKRIAQLEQWGDHAEVANTVEYLKALPGFPGGRLGDHYEVRVRATPRLVVPPSYGDARRG